MRLLKNDYFIYHLVVLKFLIELIVCEFRMGTAVARWIEPTPRSVRFVSGYTIRIQSNIKDESNI